MCGLSGMIIKRAGLSPMFLVQFPFCCEFVSRDHVHVSYREIDYCPFKAKGICNGRDNHAAAYNFFFLCNGKAKVIMSNVSGVLYPSHVFQFSLGSVFLWYSLSTKNRDAVSVN